MRRQAERIWEDRSTLRTDDGSRDRPRRGRSIDGRIRFYHGYRNLHPTDRGGGQRGGISVDLYNADGTIDESTWIDYDDHGLAVSREGDEPPVAEREVTTDAMRLDLQIERLADAFEVRLLGDTGTLETQRVEDEKWGLERARA
ncbi:hypothetical protein [Halalkalicoccus salilacus]|uniref:hypothetical protein n=1 Tax=Halalkalicoccus sp. GCM10025704 TaxID=3252662 RepID=UPI00362103DA